MVYAWPTAEIGMMDSTLAAKIMYADSDAETINAKVQNTERFSQVRYLRQDVAM